MRRNAEGRDSKNEINAPRRAAVAVPTPSLADKSLAIVCPMANEASSARSFVEEVLRQCEPLGWVRFFVVIDRVSRDGTHAILKQLAETEPRLEVVWAPQNTCV